MNRSSIFGDGNLESTVPASWHTPRTFLSRRVCVKILTRYRAKVYASDLYSSHFANDRPSPAGLDEWRCRVLELDSSLSRVGVRDGLMGRILDVDILMNPVSQSPCFLR
ncbi:hypothetical protein IF2G_07354 [Cordyceps javanica]|nr:hypothetical protein IF2G_07354 [Cordyceps javanica]